MIWSVNQIKHKWFPYWFSSIYHAENIQLPFISCSIKNNCHCPMWSAKRNISLAGKGVFPMIPGHALEKNTRNLCRFFSFLFQEKIRPHVRPHGRLYRRLCRTRGFCVQRLCGPQYYLSSFQLFQQKRWSRGRFNCISTLACEGPVCVAVLTSFYGRFFVEVGQFFNSKSFHLGRHFFYNITKVNRALWLVS